MNIVIFAGGVGTRLWPLSRKKTPKQFGKIIEGKSTLQQTIDRLRPDFSEKDVFIATGDRYEEVLKEQLPEIPDDHFIFEPAMRDVGPAIGLAAFTLYQRNPDEAMAILWSDHMVKKPAEFRKMLLGAEHLIENNQSQFVLLAQKPRFANQNMGWIHVGEQLPEVEGIASYEFQSFKYRPTQEEASEFMKSGKYMWNLGYFVTTPRHLVSLYKSFAPEMASALEELIQINDQEKFREQIQTVYPSFEKISFDDLIIQKMSKDGVGVLAEDLEWSDVGAWESLKEALQEHDEENVTHGNVSLVDSKNSLVFNYEWKLVVGIDLDDLVVVNTDDVVLICHSRSIPKVKKFVEALEGSEHEHLI